MFRDPAFGPDSAGDILSRPAPPGLALRSRNEVRCQRILNRAAPLITGDLRWDEIGDVQLEPAVIDALVYMRDVEGFTDRDLVGFTAHRSTLGDPLVARFLDIWRAEEAGHARAIEAFLERYGSRRGVAIAPRQQPPPPVVPLTERLVSRVGGPVGTVVAAAHMTWGAANELLTLNGYRLLADRCRHPVLAPLLRRIAAQEAKHFSFYLLQAQWRLAASRTARTVVARLLAGTWTPVGVGDGYKSPAEFAQLLAYLGSGPDARHLMDRMDQQFSSLPGLGALQIYRNAAASALPAA